MKRSATQDISSFFTAKVRRIQDDTNQTQTQDQTQTQTHDPTQTKEKTQTNTSTPKQTKHRSSFYQPWLQKYQWLTYDNDEGMFCSLCLKHKQGSRSQTWTKVGCVSYREDSIQRHVKSDTHMVAVALERDRLQSQTTGGIVTAIDKVITVERQAFIAALRCMYFLLKRELPHTTNFSATLELAKEIGCDYLNTLSVDNRTNYTSFRTMQEMVWCLGEDIREDVLSVVRSANYFSLLIDETTDVSVLKQLILYSKVVVEEQTVIKFLALDDLPNGTADTITTSIRTFCTENDIPLRGRLAALGSDGASVMVGRKAGVAVKLQDDNDFILSHHCVALSQKILNALMMVSTQGPDSKEFNFTRAATLWNNIGNRRIDLGELATDTDLSYRD